MAMQLVPEKKILWTQIRQFSCLELPKPIKVHAETNRAFSQKKENPIYAGCDRGFAAFCYGETATHKRQKQMRPSLRFYRARLMATQHWHFRSVYCRYRRALCGRSSSGLFQSR